MIVPLLWEASHQVYPGYFQREIEPCVLQFQEPVRSRGFGIRARSVPVLQILGRSGPVRWIRLFGVEKGSV